MSGYLAYSAVKHTLRADTVRLLLSTHVDDDLLQQPAMPAAPPLLLRSFPSVEGYQSFFVPLMLEEGREALRQALPSRRTPAVPLQCGVAHTAPAALPTSLPADLQLGVELLHVTLQFSRAGQREYADAFGRSRGRGGGVGGKPIPQTPHASERSLVVLAAMDSAFDWVDKPSRAPATASGLASPVPVATPTQLAAAEWGAARVDASLPSVVAATAVTHAPDAAVAADDSGVTGCDRFSTSSSGGIGGSRHRRPPRMLLGMVTRHEHDARTGSTLVELLVDGRQWVPFAAAHGDAVSATRPSEGSRPGAASSSTSLSASNATFLAAAGHKRPPPQPPTRHVSPGTADDGDAPSSAAAPAAKRPRLDDAPADQAAMSALGAATPTAPRGVATAAIAVAPKGRAPAVRAELADFVGPSSTRASTGTSASRSVPGSCDTGSDIPSAWPVGVWQPSAATVAALQAADEHAAKPAFLHVAAKQYAAAAMQGKRAQTGGMVSHVAPSEYAHDHADEDDEWEDDEEDDAAHGSGGGGGAASPPSPPRSPLEDDVVVHCDGSSVGADDDDDDDDVVIVEPDRGASGTASTAAAAPSAVTHAAPQAATASISSLSRVYMWTLTNAVSMAREIEAVLALGTYDRLIVQEVLHATPAVSKGTDTFAESGASSAGVAAPKPVTAAAPTRVKSEGGNDDVVIVDDSAGDVSSADAVGAKPLIAGTEQLAVVPRATGLAFMAPAAASDTKSLLLLMGRAARKAFFPSQDYRRFYMGQFNVSQRNAIAAAVLSPGGFTLIQGPPGTGKSTAIVGLLNTLHLSAHSFYNATMLGLVKVDEMAAAVAQHHDARVQVDAAAAAMGHLTDVSTAAAVHEFLRDRVSERTAAAPALGAPVASAAGGAAPSRGIGVSMREYLTAVPAITGDVEAAALPMEAADAYCRAFGALRAVLSLPPLVAGATAAPGASSTPTFSTALLEEVLDKRVLPAYELRPRILVTAPSNTAVDGLVRRIVRDQFCDGTLAPSASDGAADVTVGKATSAGASASSGGSKHRSKPSDKLNKYAPVILRIGEGASADVRAAAGVYLEDEIAKHISMTPVDVLHVLTLLQQDRARVLVDFERLRSQMELATTTAATGAAATDAGRAAYEQARAQRRFLHANAGRIVALSASYARIVSRIKRMRLLEASLLEAHGAAVSSYAASNAAASRREAHDRHLALKDRFRNALLGDADIVLTTTSSAGLNTIDGFIDATGSRFDIVIVDEAGQGTEPSTLIPLRYGCCQAVLVGDPMQLPPTVLSRVAQKRGYDRSLLGRLMEPPRPAVPCADTPDAIITAPAGAPAFPYHMLDTQYRSHPAISAFPSRYFYGGRLLDDRSVTGSGRANPMHNTRCFGPLRFFNVLYGRQMSGAEYLASVAAAPTARAARGGGAAGGRQPRVFIEGMSPTSSCNPAEAAYVVALLRALNEWRGTDARGTRVKFTGTVAVISFYRSQVALLKHLIAEAFPAAPAGAGSTPVATTVGGGGAAAGATGAAAAAAAAGPRPLHFTVDINTVDGFQGQERDVVILSCVRTCNLVQPPPPAPATAATSAAAGPPALATALGMPFDGLLLQPRGSSRGSGAGSREPLPVPADVNAATAASDVALLSPAVDHTAGYRQLALLAPDTVGFLADPRRMNVALTRAIFSCWVIGHSAALSTSLHWRALLAHALATGAVLPVPDADTHPWHLQRMVPPGAAPVGRPAGGVGTPGGASGMGVHAAGGRA